MHSMNPPPPASLEIMTSSSLEADTSLGAIQVLCNVVGVGVSNFPGSIMEVYGSMLLALRGGRRESIFQKKRYVTLEWPHIQLC